MSAEIVEQPPSNMEGEHVALSIADIVKARMNAARVTKRVREEIQHRKNLDYLRHQSKTGDLSIKNLKYEPKVSERFLEEWLDFPRQERWVWYNQMLLAIRWLTWTNKALAGLDPRSTTIRERLCNSISVIGTAAGLFLVLAVAGFLQPPGNCFLLLFMSSLFIPSS
jgi:hypothetical protein